MGEREVMSVDKYREYSVLMSVYHKEKPEYLRQAIESIQSQTFPTDDFVLVCDGLERCPPREERWTWQRT